MISISGQRKSPSIEKPKVTRSFSFAGDEGYEVLEFLDAEGKKYRYGKSGLVIDLLKVYKLAKEVLGEEDTIFELKMLIANSKNNN